MSKVELIKENDMIIVRKSGNIQRNIERLDNLEHIGLKTPKILEIYGDSYDMEYIPNQDIKTYLENNNLTHLIWFLEYLFGTLSKNQFDKDYTAIYQQKLDSFPFDKYKLPFTKAQIFDKLPKTLPASEYHGDLTLENILYSLADKNFVLIDPLTTEYDSYVFDMAKLRQDLHCKWFIRNDNVYFDSKLKKINDELSKLPHYNNDYLLILMLMRVLPYTQNQNDTHFIENEIKKLWK
jgi:hypothetical protein